MRILLINPFSAVAAVRQKNIARELGKKGHEVTLMLPSYDQYSEWKSASVEPAHNVRIIHPKQCSSKRLEWCFSLYIPSALFKTLGKKFDVIHAFRPTPFSGLVGWLIAKIKRIPFVLEHGDIEWETMEALNSHPRYRVAVVRWLERFLTKRADALTVMNTKVLDYVQENYRPMTPVSLIPNGVDCALFSPSKPSRRKELEAKVNTRKILMFVGKLDNIEHIKDLLTVTAKLPPMYGLVIIGWGAKADELKELAKKLLVSERVLFLGRVSQNDLPEYLNGADILLAPFAKTKGVEHASNLKIYEYLAMAKPVIASSVGDLPAVLKDVGFLYDPGDVDGLSELIQNIPRQAIDKARERAWENDWSKIAEKCEDIYELVLV